MAGVEIGAAEAVRVTADAGRLREEENVLALS